MRKQKSPGRKSTSANQQTPPAGPFWPSDEYLDLLHRIQVIRELSAAKVPYCTPGRFRSAMLACELDRDINEKFSPPAAKLREALAAFESLASSEQRLILNGWSYDPERVDRNKMMEWLEGADINRFLSIEGFEDYQQTLRSAAPEDEFNSTTAKVRVLILEGTSKVEAVVGLMNVLLALELRWDSMIGNVPWEELH